VGEQPAAAAPRTAQVLARLSRYVTMTPRRIVGGLLLLLALFCLFGLRSHEGLAFWARLLVMVAAGFIGGQVWLGERLPGFHWRTRS
jgi:hypothetical protein